MKVVGERSGPQNEIRSFVAVTLLVRIMQCAVDFLGVLSEQFHDVDLAAVWPAAVALVARHHPNSRPDSFSSRQLCPNVETAIQPISLAARANPCRSVFASPAWTGVM